MIGSCVIERIGQYLSKRCLCLSFTDVYAGWPGSTSSASVLSRSDLHTKAEDQADGYLFPKEVSLMAGKTTENYD